MPVRRIVMVLGSTVTVVVLLFGYRTSTMGRPGERTVVAGDTGSGGTSGGSTSSSAAGPVSGAVTGPTVQTQWGPVQVKLTLEAGKITKVDVVQYPDGNPRDAEINARALPILTRETQQAQSADIDMVSGATVTSDGYLQSLQGALDKARL